MFYIGSQPVIDKVGNYAAYFGPAGYISGVRIGDQIWMQKNLSVDQYQDGTPIRSIGAGTAGYASGYDSLVWANGDTDGAYLLFGETEELSWIQQVNEKNYGKLYNSMAVRHSAGLAPEGWRVSTDVDWLNLKNYMIANPPASAPFWWGWEGVDGNNLAYFLKEPKGTHWVDASYISEDAYGFSALGAGYYDPELSGTGTTPFQDLHGSTHFWTSTPIDGPISDYTKVILMNNNTDMAEQIMDINPNRACSVRCVKECNPGV